jgi:hypothetical protein
VTGSNNWDPERGGAVGRLVGLSRSREGRSSRETGRTNRDPGRRKAGGRPK